MGVTTLPPSFPPSENCQFRSKNEIFYTFLHTTVVDIVKVWILRFRLLYTSSSILESQKSKLHFKGSFRINSSRLRICLIYFLSFPEVTRENWDKLSVSFSIFEKEALVTGFFNRTRENILHIFQALFPPKIIGFKLFSRFLHTTGSIVSCNGTNIRSVVEFQRWWVLKGKIFGQKSTYRISVNSFYP